MTIILPEPIPTQPLNGTPKHAIIWTVVTDFTPGTIRTRSNGAGCARSPFIIPQSRLSLVPVLS